jgi:hypothetical protein
MEAASTSETSAIFYETSRRNNPEVSHLYFCRSEKRNLISLSFIHSVRSTSTVNIQEEGHAKNVIKRLIHLLAHDMTEKRASTKQPKSDFSDWDKI